MNMAEAFVDLDAVAHNTVLLARAAGTAAVMAVVKADGFGHGAAAVARTALDHGATWLGVTSPAEATALRAAGLTAPMLIWMYPPTETFDDLLHAGVDVSVGSLPALEAVAEAADRTNVVAQVHLKADTGMSRGGAVAEEWPQLMAWARKFELAGLIRIRGLWSHLANAETPGDAGLRRQLRAFEAARQAAVTARLDPTITHLANSAATLQLPQTRFDLVRAGLALYGIEPVPGRTFGLRPAMTVRAQVLLTKRVPAGTGVSYGPDHVTSRETTLALVPLGFADGVPRQSTGRAHVAIHGVRCPVVGRVSMDQIVIDVGDLRVRPGDIAVMLGPGTDGEPTAAEWAQWAGTNPNDILTGIGARIPRRYGPVR
ncbi:alanine racemase [Actinoplanes lutulentus]|uniref:Alanine racemase n=1 Tax=Actinoplanes lutulentus TaxID=1287878 RepID=A0A327ZNQ1_9ACTN|nr:alanine racemase [Actinoplanes lutulentus]MBB2940613.1 alanine racemase [Actinoplanes lutulentus]RAK42924.1 alanine racemase [Actinoplanes lutulentus]